MSRSSVSRCSVLALLALLAVGLPASAAPALETDAGEAVVLCPRGETTTYTLKIGNTGADPLIWSAIAETEAAVVRTIALEGRTPPSALAYDAARTCLWAVTHAGELARYQATDGRRLATHDISAVCPNPGQMCAAADGLWLVDTRNRRFVRLDPATLTLAATIPYPPKCTYVTGLAMADGALLAASGGAVHRIDVTTGAARPAWPAAAARMAGSFAWQDGTLWTPALAAPLNRLEALDAATGAVTGRVRIAALPAMSRTAGVTSGPKPGQLWLLAYGTGALAGRMTAQLVDVSGAAAPVRLFEKGTLARGAAAEVAVRIDARALTPGRYPVRLALLTNDPARPDVSKSLLAIVHAPGPNHPPRADAGPDRTERIGTRTAPFLLTAGASADPDGDPLRLRWTVTATGKDLPIAENGLVELGVGTHDLTLRVDDYRGGTATDRMVFTVAAAEATQWSQWYGPHGSGRMPAPEGWVEHWPPVMLWRRTDITSGGYSNNSSPVINDGCVYYASRNGVWCLDAATGATLWYQKESVGNPVPAVDEARVYVPFGRTGGLACFDKRSGDLLWRVEGVSGMQDVDGSGPYSSPSVFGDVVLIHGNAVNRRTGAVLWRGGRADILPKTVTWRDRTRVLHGGQVLDAVSGQPVPGAPYIPSARLDAWFAPTVLVDGDAAWSLTSLVGVDGKPRWVNRDIPTRENYHQPLVLGDRGFYVTGGHGSGGTINAVDLRKGTYLWKAPRRWGAFSGVGNAILAHGGGEVAVLDPMAAAYTETHKAFRFDPAGANDYAPPAYGDGIIAIMGGSGLTGLRVRRSAPALETGEGGAWREEDGVLRLGGALTSTGGAETRVFIYWGARDGGTDPNAWEHREALGPRAAGPFAGEVVGAKGSTTYFYRTCAENAWGISWGPRTERIAAYATGAPERRGLALHWPMEEETGTRLWDAAGQGHHGQPAPQTTLARTTGSVGRGIDLSERGAVRSTVLTPALTADCTVAWWLRFTEVGGSLEGEPLLRLLEVEGRDGSGV